MMSADAQNVEHGILNLCADCLYYHQQQRDKGRFL